MNLKESPNIILIVLIVVLLGVIGYLLWIKIPALMPPAQQIPPPAQEAPPGQEVSPEVRPTPEPAPVNWENLRPEIERITRPIFVHHMGEPGRTSPIDITPIDDITNDGIPEAFVSLFEGRASIEILVRIENDRPVVAQFRLRNGNVGPRPFTVAPMAVAYGQHVFPLPNRNVIYEGTWTGVAYRTIDCSVEVYQWNPQTRTFDFSLNKDLNNEIRLEFCRKVEGWKGWI